MTDYTFVLLNEDDKMVDEVLLEPDADTGSIHIGIDGNEEDTTGLREPHSGGLVPGIESFAGQTTDERCQAFRLAHPDDPRGLRPGHVEGPVDFFIVPYNAGVAIDFHGIVECWVEEWSIHNNNRQGNPAGDEARLWVGNNLDTGAILLTAHCDGEDTDPRNRWVRLVSRNFAGDEGNGSMQFVLVDDEDDFLFMTGDTGGWVGEVGDPVEIVRIKGSNGYIGSGTNAPEARFHAAGAGGVQGFRMEDIGGGALGLGQGGGTSYFATYDDDGDFSGMPMQMSAAGVGFNGASPSRPAVAAAATDAASAVTLANSLRQKLIDMGLVTA